MFVLVEILVENTQQKYVYSATKSYYVALVGWNLLCRPSWPELSRLLLPLCWHVLKVCTTSQGFSGFIEHFFLPCIVGLAFLF